MARLGPLERGVRLLMLDQNLWCRDKNNRLGDPLMMKKLFLILIIFGSLYSQDVPAKRVRTDSLKTLSSRYLDSLWIKSRIHATRPAQFDSLVRFFTNFAVPSGSSYDSSRLMYKSDTVRILQGTNIAVTYSGHNATINSVGGGSVGNADSLGSLPASSYCDTRRK